MKKITDEEIRKAAGMQVAQSVATWTCVVLGVLVLLVESEPLAKVLMFCIMFLAGVCLTATFAAQRNLVDRSLDMLEEEANTTNQQLLANVLMISTMSPDKIKVWLPVLLEFFESADCTALIGHAKAQTPEEMNKVLNMVTEGKATIKNAVVSVINYAPPMLKLDRRLVFEKNSEE